MRNRRIGTIVLVIAMIIVAISVLFTNNLARALQEEEKKKGNCQSLSLSDSDS